MPSAKEMVGLWRAGQEAWPGVPLAAESFCAWAADRLGEDAGSPDDGTEAAAARAADLYLACACATGEPRAIEAFERAHLPQARRALARFRLADHELDDVLQQIRCRLFVDGDLGAYSGRGALDAWVRTVAIRAGLKAVRLARRALAGGDDALSDLSDGSAGPELAHLKATYGEPFRQALRDAIPSLTLRQRNLLRQHFLDGLSIDALARIYRVHRATAARWIVDARADLLETTHALLVERLGVAEDEVPSLLRLVRSELDVTMSPLFRQANG